MLVSKHSHSLNLRELMGYVFILTLFALGIALFLLLARMLAPRADWNNLGAVQELNQPAPTIHHLIAQDGTRVSVWLVKTTDGWLAFDGITPDSLNMHCLYAYQAVTHRFEDPCSGFKYMLNGSYIDQSYYAHDLSVQDLTQYPISVANDQISVDLSQPRVGTQWRANATPLPLP